MRIRDVAAKTRLRVVPLRMGKTGFTLIELIFVLMIILILVALIVPVAAQRLRDAQLARAKADIQTIAVALLSFQVDLGRFPACDDENCDPLNIGNQTLRFLAFGDGTGDIQDTFPDDDPNLVDNNNLNLINNIPNFIDNNIPSLVNKWGLSNPDNMSDFPARNNAFNHLGRNDPNADNIAGTDNAGLRDYKDGDGRSKRWRGPYVANVSLDPWGHAYIVHVGAMDKNGIPVIVDSLQNSLGSFDKPQGWILSAGPDGMLQTSPTDTALSGDDIGFIFFTSTSKRNLGSGSSSLFERERFLFRVTPTP